MQTLVTSKIVVRSKGLAHRYTACGIVLLLVAGVLVPGAFAQFRASIQGAVTDTTGAVIQGAAVTLTDLGTNKVLTSTTNAAGLFNFNALPPDRFSLTAEKSGFQKQVLNDVELIPEQANSINVQLSAGAASQTVTVNASDTPALDTETANVSGTVGSNEIQHLPSFGRDVFQLAQLAPGISGDSAQASGGGTYNRPGNQGPGGSSNNSSIFGTENRPQIQSSGGRNEANAISVDGISTVSAVWGGASVITPSEDSVDNLKIVSNSYDAENGRFSGAQLQVTTKSGTNAVHGSLFFKRDSAGLNAYQRWNGPSSESTTKIDPATGLLVKKTAVDRGLNRNSQQFNNYGGSVGGPIWKNKLFAFFNYETVRQKSSTSQQNWYETAAFHSQAPAGSIAATLLAFPGTQPASSALISKSCTDLGLIEGTNCRTIAGQGLDIGSPLKLPLGTQDPTYKSSTTPGVGSGLDGVADVAFFNTLNPTTVTEAQYNGRLDADLTHRDRLSFTIYWVPNSQTYYNGPIRPANLWHHEVINDAFAGIWNHTFTPTLLNEARANAAGFRWNEVSTNTQAPFGLPQENFDDLGTASSTSNTSTASLQYLGAPGPTVLNQWTYSYRDILTKIQGRHALKFGGELTRLYYLNSNYAGARPQYNFRNIWNFANDAPYKETGTFDPLTGLVSVHRLDERENLWGFFAQDDFKVTPTLTINLGLRWSYFASMYSKQNNLGVVQLGGGANSFTGLRVRTGGHLYDPQKSNLGPQLGFAWTPTSLNGKMVLRGGFGLNYNQNEIAITANGGGNPPGVVSPTLFAGEGLVYGISGTPKSFYGYPSNPNTISGFGPNGLPLTGTLGLVGFPSSPKSIMTYHYSLDTQYDLGHQLVASLGYSGTLGRHNITHRQQNILGVVNGTPLNPQVNSFEIFDNNGSSNYHALLAGLKHNFSHTFLADAKYTWSKSMDTNSGPYTEDPYPYDPTLAYGRSDYNIGQAFKVYGLWQPVIFRGSHGWLEKVAGGWSVSGIFNLHSGFPWTPVYNVPGGNLYYQGSGYGSLRPTAYLGGARHDTSNSAFKSGPGGANPTAHNKNFPNGPTAYYTIPTASDGTPLTSTLPPFPTPVDIPGPGISRNSLNGPGYNDVDGTLSKAFGLPTLPVLGESAKFEIRADVFNVLNKENLNVGSISNQITSDNFGQAQSALGSRTIEVQARFSF